MNVLKVLIIAGILVTFSHSEEDKRAQKVIEAAGTKLWNSGVSLTLGENWNKLKCETAGSCEEKTIAVVEVPDNKDANIKTKVLLSPISKALKCKDGECVCVDEDAKKGESSCLRKPVAKEQCIMNQECADPKKPLICLPKEQKNTEEEFVIRTCQASANTSRLSKTVLGVTILVILSSLRI